MTNAAKRLLDKLRAFSEALDPAERSLLAALLAPGIALAKADGEVTGFAMVHWLPSQLPDSLEQPIQGPPGPHRSAVTVKGFPSS